jgi:hypothetical protein
LDPELPAVANGYGVRKITAHGIAIGDGAARPERHAINYDRERIQLAASGSIAHGNPQFTESPSKDGNVKPHAIARRH